MNAQKIIGNIGLAELALLAIGGGLAGYFFVKRDLVTGAEAAAIVVVIASLADLVASGVAIGANSNNMLPGGSATVAGAQ